MLDFNKRGYVMFDLDGTVSDSKQGIFGGVIYAMNRLHMEIPGEDVLRKFIGPSIGATFKSLYGFTQEQADEATAIYREYYGSRGYLECSLYPGMRELLDKLHAQGKKVALATKKPQDFTDRIMESFGLDRVFDVVEGSSLDDKSEYKGYVLEKVIARFGMENDKQNVVMVGDSKYDVIAANMAGVDCIGEAYGYGDVGEMTAEGAALIVRDMDELTQVLAGEK